MAEVAAEVRNLVARGYKEIVLTGICLGAYGRDLKPRRSLADLIKVLEKTRGLLRIRLSSIEAGDVSDELISLMARSKKLCPHLHIPIQSGDDAILAQMNRSYTGNEYLALIRKIKRKIPKVAITADVLVGFPGETEAQFKNTIDLVKNIQPLRTHIFPFSPRAGTAADCLADRISPEVIRKRITRLKKVAHEAGLGYQKQFLNHRVTVLFEQEKKSESGIWEGHTRQYIKVLMKSEKDLQNKIVRVALTKIDGESLRAKINI